MARPKTVNRQPLTTYFDKDLISRLGPNRSETVNTALRLYLGAQLSRDPREFEPAIEEARSKLRLAEIEHLEADGLVQRLLKNKQEALDAMEEKRRLAGVDEKAEIGHAVEIMRNSRKESGEARFLDLSGIWAGLLARKGINITPTELLKLASNEENRE